MGEEGRELMGGETVYDLGFSLEQEVKPLDGLDQG